MSDKFLQDDLINLVGIRNEESKNEAALYIMDKYPKIFKEFETARKVADLLIHEHNAKIENLRKEYPKAIINPLGYWTGGSDVDSGATNRKLGSDMARCVTGGGLHGKDLSKADVAINIYAFLKAQKENKEIKISCAIGDLYVDGKKYSEIVDIARKYINKLGGFEKLAEWGLY